MWETRHVHKEEIEKRIQHRSKGREELELPGCLLRARLCGGAHALAASPVESSTKLHSE